MAVRYLPIIRWVGTDVLFVGESDDLNLLTYAAGQMASVTAGQFVAVVEPFGSYTVLAADAVSYDLETSGGVRLGVNSSTIDSVLAQKWAENPEDDEVEPGAFSALHHAAKAAASAASAALYDGPWLDNITALLADTSLTYTLGQPATVAAGDIVRTRAEGFSYEVAASGASDHHVTTAGGVKLYVPFTGRAVEPEQFGEIGVSAAQDTAVLAAWASWASNRSNFKLVARGTYQVAGSDVVISNSDCFELDTAGSQWTQTVNFQRTLQIIDCDWFRVKGNGKWNGRGGAAGEFNGASTSWNGVAGIFLKRVNNFSVRDQVLRSHAGGSIVYRDADNFQFKDNDVEGIGSDFISYGGNGGDFGIGGFSDNTTRADFSGQWVNNRIRGHAFGVFGNRMSSLIFAGNDIQDIPGQHGAYFIECGGAVVTDNVFKNIAQNAFKNQLEEYQSRGLAPSTNHGLIYSGNVVDGAQDALAILYSPPSAGDQVFRGLQIGPNVVRNTTQDGYALDRCVGFNIAGHRIADGGRHPVRIQAGSGTIGDGFEAVNFGSGARITMIGPVRIGKAMILDCGATGSSIYNMPLGVEAPSGSVPATSTADANPLLEIDGLALNYTTGDTAGANIARIAHSAVRLRIRNCTTTSPKTFRHDGTLLEAFNNGFRGFNSGAQNSPATFLTGRVAQQFYGQQNPQASGSTDDFLRGDICWNTAPTADGSSMVIVGWICTVAGSPGTWVAMRTSTVSPAN